MMAPTPYDVVVTNARVMTCDPARAGLGIVEHGAVAVQGGAIAWVGAASEAPAAREVIDVRGQLVTPGLVDCHTHAIFAGDRAHEFALRARGAGYLEIAAAGGGINATLGPTRAATDAELIETLRGRLRLMRGSGATTVEVKSGYDLTVAGELRLLRCIAAAQTPELPRLVPTLLAHLIPPERTADRDAFVRELCEELIPAAARDRLCAAVDVYCDEGAFTLAESRAILGAAHAVGLAVKGHVGQFTDLGGAHLLAELGALSGEHLERIDDAGIAALARAGVVAVMLPGACIQVRLPVPPIEKLRAAGVAMAIASDLNPGTSYCEALPVQLWLACTHFGMTVEEAWLGVTRIGARALGLGTTGIGTLTVGAPADLVWWRCTDPATVPYRYAAPLVERVWRGGVAVERSPHGA